MQNALTAFQVVLAFLLITAILLQSRGAGLGGVFGGGGEVYRTKRGAEKYLLVLTGVLAALFLGISLINSIIF